MPSDDRDPTRHVTKITTSFTPEYCARKIRYFHFYKNYRNNCIITLTHITHQDSTMNDATCIDLHKPELSPCDPFNDRNLKKKYVWRRHQERDIHTQFQ